MDEIQNKPRSSNNSTVFPNRAIIDGLLFAFNDFIDNNQHILHVSYNHEQNKLFPMHSIHQNDHCDIEQGSLVRQTLDIDINEHKNTTNDRSCNKNTDMA